MTDILSNYFVHDFIFKNDNSIISTSSNTKNLYSQYGLKLPYNKITLKLPKININDILIEHNKSNEVLKNNKTEENINNLNIISKLNYKNPKQFIRYNKKAKSNNKISDLCFKNNIISELNKSGKNNINNKDAYNSQENPIILKENLNNPYIKRNKNINYFPQYTERNNNQDKEEKVKEYISILLNDDKSKNASFNSRLYTLNKKKNEEYSLTKSIDPKKYIKNLFLDESYNNNIFKTSKIQLDCFNGNEHLRNINIKKINANNMNNLNVNSLKIKSNDTPTKLLIDEMFQGQKNLNNFHFGKKLYKKIFLKNKFNDDINNYTKIRRNEIYNKNVVLSLDDKIKSIMNETKNFEKKFIDRHKSRGKIIRKIRQFCDNYDGIVRRASTYDNYKIIKKSVKLPNF